VSPLDVNTMGPEFISFSRRITELAAKNGDAPAVTLEDYTVSWRELEARANRLARDLATRGVGTGDMVTIAVPNSPEWFIAFAAAWKIGAVPQPVSYRLPPPELKRILELAGSKVVIGGPAGLDTDALRLPADYDPPTSLDSAPLPDVLSPAWKAPTSGGSTGLPKLIVAGAPSVLKIDTEPPWRMRAGDCLVMPGPLYHNGPLMWSWQALLWDARVVVMPRFDAEATLAAIERHRGNVILLVPTMMKRIIRLPEHARTKYDVSTLRVVWHMGEPCPEWLKQQWIDWLGAEKIYEVFGGTEAIAATQISGTEWLAHRGSVGKPMMGEIMICDEHGNEVPPGTMGEIWLKSGFTRPGYKYVGADARARPGGWESLGDMGKVDEGGYLYLGDRKTDMILSGGANVYPNEVEGQLQEHPGVLSCAVIGLPDDDLGQRVHAIVQAEASVTTSELVAFLEGRLVRYKVPRTFEFVDQPLRDDAGKVRRSALRSERVNAA
jgi:bile acid-coenzyme A ligase